MSEWLSRGKAKQRAVIQGRNGIKWLVRVDDDFLGRYIKNRGGEVVAVRR